MLSFSGGTIIAFFSRAVLRIHHRNVVGEITDCEIRKYERDDEFESFRIKYRFTYSGKLVIGNDNFVLNTAHIAWAHAGQLLGFPKSNFTREDVVLCLRPGSRINIIVFPSLPRIHRIDYDPIVYEASRF